MKKSFITSAPGIAGGSRRTWVCRLLLYWGNLTCAFSSRKVSYSKTTCYELLEVVISIEAESIKLFALVQAIKF